MATKTTSPEAEQKKLWKLEIKQLESNRRKVHRDHETARAKLEKAIVEARKQLGAFDKRANKSVPRALADIDRRLGILNGRIHA